MTLYAILGGIGAAVLAIFTAFARGRKSAKIESELNTAKATEKAHERLNNAEAGTDSDADNIASLRDFVAKYGKR